MTIITEETMEETIEETMDATVEGAGAGVMPEAVENVGERIMSETVEDAGRGNISETVEDAGGGNISETVEETAEQVKGKTVSGIWKRHGFRTGKRKPDQERNSGMKVQREQWKRMAGWLAPYLAVLLLIMMTGGAILLMTGMKTDHLSKQIQEQYGEYFTDGQ